MTEFASWLFKALPPLSKTKNSQIAAVLGFLFGGIGLGIYFLSFIDFLIPILFAILLVGVLPSSEGALLAGAIISALWGYLRVENSNSRFIQK